MPTDDTPRLSKQAIEGRGLELLERLLQIHGIHYKWDGGDLLFALRAEDHNPSCRASKNRDGGWKDFGSDESGDALTLIADLERLSIRREFAKVLERAYEILGIPKPIAPPKAANGSGPKREPTATLGPAPTLETFLAHYGLEWSDFENAGVEGPRKFYFPQLCAEGDALIYPIRLRNGSIVPKAKTISRTIDKNARLSASKKGCSFKDGFFGDPADATGRTLVIAGGEEKRLAAVKAGFAAVAPTHGEKLLEPECLAWVLESRPADIIIAFDADRAGFKGSLALARQLTDAGFKGSIGTVPWTKDVPEKSDINDILKEQGPAGLRTFIESARPIEDNTLPPELLCSDIANAMRFGDRYHPRLAYDIDRGNWLHYDGKRWVEDVGASYTTRCAKELPGMIVKEAVKANRDTADGLLRWATKSAMLPRINAAVTIATCDERIAVRTHSFDADPHAFNVQNGTLDLRTGTLRPHSKDDRITRIGNAPYDPNADCPTWKAFLHRVLCGNEDLIAFLQRAIGYSMTALTDEQCFFFLYGTGANGKTTFVETLRWLFGGYSRQANPDSFLQDDKGGSTGGQARPDLVALVGARFVTATEVDRGRRFAEAIVKSLTGQDSRQIRTLYGSPFEWTPTMKLFMAANHRPAITGSDQGIWRRINMIPFTAYIPPEERDKSLMNRLRAEAPGILNWAVQGARSWYTVSLLPPAAVKAATEEYREESDPLAGFLTQCCIVGKQFQESAQALYASYERWCKEGGENPVKQRTFGTTLTEKGFKSGKGAKGMRRWQGIRLRQEGERVQEHQPTPSFDTPEDLFGGHQVADVAEGGGIPRKSPRAQGFFEEFPEKRHLPPLAPPSTTYDDHEDSYPDYEEEERRAIQDF